MLAAVAGGTWWARQAPPPAGDASGDDGRVAVEVAWVETGHVGGGCGRS